MGKKIKAIGIIHTPFHSKDACPVQPIYAGDASGTVEVFDEYAPGLKDIETFSHIYLLYVFDRAGKLELIRPPFLDDTPRGIFASRHPCRPNAIGISIVNLVARSHNVLTVKGVDVLDNTPLIDIKPYVPKFDIFGQASNGWLESKHWRPKPRHRE
jgi:tRNA-Thr(GGU) m(6)t(6)A37 methyltransferase TsaA